MGDNRIICGDCLEVLKTLPAESVNCCITSPPYFGLRNYQVEGQIGLETTIEEYVAKLVAVFAEVKRVLKLDGVFWLNLGDSYQSHPGDYTKCGGFQGKDARVNGEHKAKYDGCAGGVAAKAMKLIGLKPKDLCGIPWRVAFALQKDGWYLRQDIIWAKPNPMPESVTDRCTKSHEYIFLLTKSAKYYYDNEAIKEDSTEPESYTGRKFRSRTGVYLAGAMPGVTKTKEDFTVEEGKTYPKRNRRSVWTVNVDSCGDGEHFAVFPEELIEPCVLAGCPEGGICLDPFLGSGTVAAVALKNKRNYIGIELNPKFIEIAERRIKAIETGVTVAEQRKGQKALFE
jgi:DNA modification methylase